MRFSILKWAKMVAGVLTAFICLEVGLRWVDLGLLNVWSPHTSRGHELYRVDPNIGWVLKGDLDTTWVTRDGHEVRIETNTRGLRDREHAYQKETGVYRILLLGDSFVEALQLPVEDIFPTTLESCLANRLGRPIEVINGGMTAYSIGDNYLYYLQEGYKYDPDLVLISVFSEYALLDLDRQADQTMVRVAGAYRFDANGDSVEKRWLSWTTPEKPGFALAAMLQQYSLVYQILWHPDAKFRTAFTRLNERLAAAVGYGDSPHIETEGLPPWNHFVFASDFPHNPATPPALRERWQLFQLIFQAFHHQSTVDNTQLAVLIIPNKYQAHRRFRDEQILQLAQSYSDLSTVSWDLEREPNRTWVQFFQQQQLPVLDLLPYFQVHDAANGASLYFNEDLHFNREGHYMTRDVLCNWLIETNLVPP